jgi:RHS repeat-associated protein
MTSFRQSEFCKGLCVLLSFTTANLSAPMTLCSSGALLSRAVSESKKAAPVGLWFGPLPQKEQRPFDEVQGHLIFNPEKALALAEKSRDFTSFLDSLPAASPAPVVSRALTADEMQLLSGRLGENPYIAGTQKFAIIVNGLDVLTGNFTTAATDLTFEGGYGIPVNVTRSYSSNSPDYGPLGKGWNLSVDIRTTAGGLLKSSGSGVRSVPTTYKERLIGADDPRIPDANEPVETVSAADASGFEETIQKDADGILTTPPWDKNDSEAVYDTVTSGGDVYQILVSNTVRTPEGTVYVYATKGYYDGGVDPNGDAMPSNILKIVSVTDRHGNETTYSYSNDSVPFYRGDGIAHENKLTHIEMPNGHEIDFTWTNLSLGGNPIWRITEASDGDRDVTYSYSFGQLTSVTSPGGKVTSYEYGTAEATALWYGDQADDLLVKITDPRGMETNISYVMAESNVPPYNVTLYQGAICHKVEAPNGLVTRMVVLWGEEGEPPGPQWGQFQVSIGDEGDILSWGWATLTPHPTEPEFTITMLDDKVLAAGNIDGTVWTRRFDARTQDLLEEHRITRPRESADLHSPRKYPSVPFTKHETITETSYNFMGNPLSKTITEKSSSTTIRSSGIQYAYWGADKYYQQKAVKDPADRVSFTDYFDDEAAQGSKGQVKRVYSEAFCTFSNKNASDWKYTIVPNVGKWSAEFEYDSKGRPVKVWKLQDSAASSGGYVLTETSYGSDGSPTWGGATEVIEDESYSSHGTYGSHTGVNRSTQTLTYDAAGRAVEVQDAAAKQFTTTYDDDGVVQSVYRTDTSPSQMIVSYDYGTSGVANGMPTQVTDGLSGVYQTFSYVNNAGHGDHGQVSSITETNNSVSYTTSYTYHEDGSRAMATYTTPQGTTKWGYDDYISVGMPESFSRVFQTLNKANSSTGAFTTEEMHYHFDSSGRILFAAFAQSPQTEGIDPPTSAPFYTNDYPALKRALSSYQYEPGGRMTKLENNWQVWGGSSYSDTKIQKSEYIYDETLGLKTNANFNQNNGSNAWAQYHKQAYDYDADLDYLIQAKYDDDGNNSWDETVDWTYDTAGNRASDTSNSGSWTYDYLNRMSASPGVSYTNDILGNRTFLDKTGTVNDVTYTWDALNRLITYEKNGGARHYAYRADGMRVSKIRGSGGQEDTTYRYDGQMLMEEYFAGTEYPRDYLQVIRYGLGARGIDYIERVRTQSGTDVGFPLYDGHGNMIGTLMRHSTSGFTVGDTRRYGAWGDIRTGNATGEPNPRYCANLGHVQDDESGLVYMRARYYEASSGRFISEDPEREGWNAYSYCRNDPINFTDRTGKFMEILLGLGIGALVGLISGLLSVAGQQLSTGISAQEAGLRILASVLSGGVGGAAGAASKNASLGSAASAFVNSILRDLFDGRAIRWGKAFLAAGVGGVIGGAIAWASGVSARAGLMGDLANGSEKAFDRALAMFGGHFASNCQNFLYQ